MKIKNKKLKFKIKTIGILENNLILNKFFKKNKKNMSEKEIYTFLKLFKISEINLMKIILKKKINNINYPTNIKKLLKKIQHLNFKNKSLN